MTPASEAPLLDMLSGLVVGGLQPGGSNGVVIEGLATRPGPDGTLEAGVQKLEATGLRVAAGPWVLELGRLTLRTVVAQLRVENGSLRVQSLQAQDAEVADLQVSGPLQVQAQPARGAPPAGSWCLEFMAAAEGTLRAEIVDAHLLFDADVTVPIRRGQVDFNKAKVEHVGPDSRMGVSRMGLYVDAPNGRSYLYQFTAAVVAGVAYERRGAMLTPFVSDRGRLQLQPFAEAVLQQGVGHGPGLTDQARLLFDRTSVAGEVQLGDGRFAAPGVQAHLVGRGEGRNSLRVHSESVGRGVTVDVPALAIRDARVEVGSRRVSCKAIDGQLVLGAFMEGGQLRCEARAAALMCKGLQLGPRDAYT